MPKVNILPPDVISKIAAGEVVDRPASVVKELLENSLDSGATSIEINLKDAGKDLIHIKDNGSGIAKEDLEQIFQRHATSKIKDIDDLERLSSMGFRGEALYSIAAVSDVVLKSQLQKGKSSAEYPAWEIHLRGSKRLSLEPAAPSGAGTDIKIAELFFNTPARRKFLKANSSELNAILNIVLPYALIHPEIKFALIHTGRSLLDLKPAKSRIERTAKALNLSAKDLIECAQDYPAENIKVKAILGNINVQRPRRDLQYIFINGRPVESKSLSFNINDIYKLILPPGVYGAFVFDIHLDPANVDVNIHPTKREVRIKDEARLTSLMRRLVDEQLMQHGAAKVVDSRFTSTIEQGLPAKDVIFAPTQLQTMFETSGGSQSPSESFAEFNLFGQDESLKEKFAGARFVGQFINKYLLFEAADTLMIVDQHAAQERIMFERFQNQIEAGKIEVQPLLTPLLLKLTPQERIAWDEIQDKMQDIGIETNQFDDETIAVQTQPLLLKNLEQSVRTLLGGDDISRCDRNTIARRACKASIVTGDKLSAEQAEYQRKQLLACKDPFTCPHGRPTVIEIKDTFLERQFLRT